MWHFVKYSKRFVARIFVVGACVGLFDVGYSAFFSLVIKDCPIAFCDLSFLYYLCNEY